MNRLSKVFMLCTFNFSLAICSSCWAQPATNDGSLGPTAWLRGRAFQLAAREQTLSIDWLQAPLRDHLRPLAALRKTSIFVDRRIDPQLPITLSLNQSTLEQILWRIADEHSWGVAELENGYYLGPIDKSLQLTHLIAGNSELESALATHPTVAQKLRREMNVFSEDVVEPRTLIGQLISTAGIEIANLEAIPHDVWAPLDLPRSSLQQHLLLLLVGFDLTISVRDDGVLELIAIDIQPPFTRKITGLKKAEDWSERLKSQAPQLEVIAKDDSMTITGGADDLILASKAIATLHRPPQRAAAPAQIRYTLETKAQRGQIVASVAKQLSVQWTYPSEFRRQMEETVELNVREVELAELMEKTLSGTGLGYKLTDGKLEIIVVQLP